MKLKLLFIYLFLLLIMPVVPCFADQSDDNAKSAFEEGTQLFQTEKYLEAAEMFRKAYDLKPNWKLLYNIGQSEAAGKRYGAAKEVFERYIAEGGDDISEERRIEVVTELERFQKIVGYVELKNVPDNLGVFIDDVYRGITPLSGPLAVASGMEHRLKLQQGGDIFLDQKIMIPSGQTRKIDFEQNKLKEIENDKSDNALGSTRSDSSPNSSSSGRSTNESKTPNPYKGLKISGIVTLGAGAAALVASAVTGTMAIALDKDMAGDCKNGCPPERYDDMDKLTTLKTSTFVLIGSGIALAATGTVLLIVRKNKIKKEVVALPVVTPNFTGATITVRF